MPILSVDVIDIVKKLKQLLRSVHKDNLKEVILFGSMARGDFDEESDIDVLVVLNDISDYLSELDKTFQIQYELGMKYDVIIGCVLARSRDYESNIDPFFLNIHQEGIPV